MKYLMTALAASALLVSCGPESKEEQEPQANQPSVVVAGGPIYRHAHDDFWSEADLFFKYYVRISDPDGIDDIQFVSIKDCATCDVVVLRDLAPTDGTDPIDHYNESSDYFSKSTFWYNASSPNIRPSQFIVTVIDSEGHEVIETISGLSTDLRELQSHEFVYSEAFVTDEAGDTTNGVPALALPSLSEVTRAGDFLQIEFNTNDVNVSYAYLWVYNANGDYLGSGYIAGSEFTNETNTPLALNTTGDSFYWLEGNSINDVNYAHLVTYSRLPVDETTWNFGSAPHSAISAKVLLTVN